MSNITVILILLAANAMAANASYGQVSTDAPVKAEAPPDNKASGSDPDFVWVNKNSHTYLCPTDSWYGKTKHGEYMSEWNAKALGYHPKHNKECGP